jgi:hypothetical protein
MVREHQTSDAQLRIGESRDSPMCNCTSQFDAELVIGPRFARTRWHRPGMTALVCSSLSLSSGAHSRDPLAPRNDVSPVLLSNGTS